MSSRKILTLVMVIALIAGAALMGCSKSKEAAASGRRVVKVWTHNRHDLAFMQKKVAEYNAANADNIEIDLGIYTDNYTQVLNLAFQTGETPDIASNNSDAFNLHYPQGRWLDLYTLMDEQMKETFSSCVWDGHNLVNGKLYYIPTMASTSRLFYNKGIFKRVGLEPPATLEEMAAAAKKITDTLKSEGIYGFAANMKSSNAALSRALNPMINRYSGIQEGYDFAKGEYDYSGYGPVLEIWKELLSPAVAFPGCESLDIDPLRAQFAAGKIAMYISFTHAEPGVYTSQFPTGEEWGVAQIPVMGGDRNSKGAQSFFPTYSFLINSASKDIQAAWKVYSELLLDTDFIKEYYEGGFGITLIPSIIAAANPAPVYRDNPALLISPTDAIWPRTPHQVNSAAVVFEGPNMWDTFAQIIYADADTQKTLSDLTGRYNRAYRNGINQKRIIEIKIPDFDPMRPAL